MPRIELIPEVKYDGLHPYNVYYDNLPIINLLERQTIMNLAIDLNADILRDAVGSSGTLANRLAQSTNDNGSIKYTSLDAPQDFSGNVTFQHIGAHRDGEFNDGSGTANYVRMLESERNKLSMIANQATNLSIEVETPSNIITLNNGTVRFAQTDSVQLDLEAPSTIKFVTAFPASAAHQHLYDRTPAHATPSMPDFQNYLVNSMATPFIEDSLRVCINGICLTESDMVYVPPYDGPDGTWMLTSYTADHTTGSFVLSRAIDENDIIRINYDTAF